MCNSDIVVEPRLPMGRRARRSLRKQQCESDDGYENGDMRQAPLMHKSWEKMMKDASYEQRRERYEYLETIHNVLAYIPQDVISIIQHKAGIQVESMPLPKVLHVRRTNHTT